MSLGKKINSFIQSLSIRGRPVIGLDIGLSSVKMVSMESKGDSYILQKYVAIPLPEGAIIEDEIQKPEEIIAAISQGAEEMGIKQFVSCIGLFGPNCIARKLQLAGGSDEEVDDQVMWEAEQYLPFDIEDSALDYHKIGENEGGGVDVIVAAARSSVIESFKELVIEAGGVVKIADLGVLAVTNLFEHLYQEQIEENYDESFLILDIGAQKTFFIIYKGESIMFTKELNVGGVMITEEIQRQMGVNYYEAEDLKITGDDQGNLPEEIIEIMDDVVEAFFSEIKKALDFYVSSTSDESLGKCIVTGGSALVPGVLEGLEALLGVEVEAMNPFERISYKEKDFSEDEVQQIIYRGAQVIGLGMRKS